MLHWLIIIGHLRTGVLAHFSPSHTSPFSLQGHMAPSQPQRTPKAMPSHGNACRTEQSLAAEPHCIRAQTNIACTAPADPLSHGRAEGHLQGHAGARTTQKPCGDARGMQDSDEHSALRRPSRRLRCAAQLLHCHTPTKTSLTKLRSGTQHRPLKDRPPRTRLQTHPTYTQKNPPAQCTLYMNTQARLGTWATACKRAGRAAEPRPSQNRCAPKCLPRLAHCRSTSMSAAAQRSSLDRSMQLPPSARPKQLGTCAVRCQQQRGSLAALQRTSH